MEVLGGVSSVFAVASLALQLTSNIQKLIEFWDSVKEAPDEIEQLKSHLRILGELLHRIELDIEESAGDEIERVGKQCLQVCNTSILKLESMSHELDMGLNENGFRRRWTCLRKAMREKQLAVYWDEVERAKSTLVVYQGLKNGQRHDMMLGMMKTLTPTHGGEFRPDTSQTNESIKAQLMVRKSSRITKVCLRSTIYEIHLSFGLVRVRMSTHITKPKNSRTGSTEITRRRNQRQITASFVPKGFLTSVFEWTIIKGYISQMTFKSFNLRPGWSPIFEYSAKGDLDKVRELIESAYASPNDVDESGWMPLHYAASNHHPDTCRLLIELGAVVDAVTDRRQSPLLLATKNHDSVPYGMVYRRFDGSCDIDTARILVQHGKNDPMQRDHTGNTPFSIAAGNTSRILRFLLDQDEYELDLTTPYGHTAAASISTRKDFPDLLGSLIRNGVNVIDPCAKA